MPVIKNEYNERSKGGTELSIAELERHVPKDLLDKFQVIPSRFRGLTEGLIPIYWVHDTAEDPEMHHLADGGWKKFARIVFVSNWQMQRFIERYGIPWSHCCVLPNAIEPFPDDMHYLDNAGTLRFIYHTTPHRGLNILAAAFDALSSRHDVHLDVYSSFSIYGWEGRDKEYEPLYDRLRANPKVTYHGARPLDEVRAALRETHAFVYPSTWPETGCRALIEAMCAGVVCATTNYGCLYETSMGLAFNYQFDENPQKLAEATWAVMENYVDMIRKMTTPQFNALRSKTSKNSQAFFSWERRKNEWAALLQEVLGDKQ
jgi:glycosyltransferase involved in cell wall biosynthesis